MVDKDELIKTVRKECIRVMKTCGYDVCFNHSNPPTVVIQPCNEFQGEYGAYYDNEANKIVFRKGRFSIDLLAHELVHSLQPSWLFEDDEFLDYHDKKSEIQAYVVSSLIDVKYGSTCGEVVYESLMANITKKIIRNLERNCRNQTFKMVA